MVRTGEARRERGKKRERRVARATRRGSGKKGEAPQPAPSVFRRPARSEPEDACGGASDERPPGAGSSSLGGPRSGSDASAAVVRTGAERRERGKHQNGEWPDRPGEDPARRAKPPNRPQGAGSSSLGGPRS